MDRTELLKIYPAICSDNGYMKGWGWSRDRNTDIWVCGKCKLPVASPFNIEYECEVCSELFRKNFSHPAFDLNSPWCWDCLEQHNPDGQPKTISEKLNQVIIRIGKKPPPPSAVFVEANFDPDMDEYTF